MSYVATALSTSSFQHPAPSTQHTARPSFATTMSSNSAASNSNNNNISWRLQKLKQRQLQLQLQTSASGTPSSATSMQVSHQQPSSSADDPAALDQGEVLSTYINQNPMIKHNRFSSASSSSASSFGVNSSNPNITDNDDYSRRNSQISTSSSTTSSIRSSEIQVDFSRKALARSVNGHSDSLRLL